MSIDRDGKTFLSRYNNTKKQIDAKQLNSIEFLDFSVGSKLPSSARYIIFNHKTGKEIFWFEGGYQTKKFNPEKIVKWIKLSGLKEVNTKKLICLDIRLFREWNRERTIFP